jgi:hypothetical protein
MRHSTSRLAVLVVIAALALTTDTPAQDRMPPIQTDKMTDAQQKAAAEFEAARGALGGPWAVMLRSPRRWRMTRRPCTTSVSSCTAIAASATPRMPGRREIRRAGRRGRDWPERVVHARRDGPEHRADAASVRRLAAAPAVPAVGLQGYSSRANTESESPETIDTYCLVPTR